MPSATLTRRARSLGARDVFTGLCANVWTESTITGSIQNAGSSRLSMALGTYNKYPYNGYIPDVIHVGDEIKDAFNYYYTVDTAEQLTRLDEFIGYVPCKLNKIDDHSDREATSGTWHVDSDILVTDSRYRTKTYLQTYLLGAALPHLDDGVTNASTVFMFAGADYPLLLELLPGGNDVDVVVTIDKATSTPRWTYLTYPYGFDETLKLELWAINKEGLTAMRLIDEMEEAIKKVVTDYPRYSVLGNIRALPKIDNPPKSLAEGLDKYTLYNSTITLKYTRANDHYVPTKPYLTYSTTLGGPYTYIFPNVIDISYNNVNNDVFMQMPSRIGNYPQALGAESFEVQITCDLDIEHTNLTWKRPQTALPKTDKMNFQVFLDIMHSAAISEPCMILTLDWGEFYVRLTKAPDIDSRNHTITLFFKEYNATPGNATFKTRFGIT